VARGGQCTRVRFGACCPTTTFPCLDAVYQQIHRLIRRRRLCSGGVHLRILPRLQADGTGQSSAAIAGSRTQQAMPESGDRAGYDRHRRRRGSQVHAAVVTLGYLLASNVTPADVQVRTQVDLPVAAVQEVISQTLALANVGQGGRHGPSPSRAAQAHGIHCEVVE
jgi:hypothetical protein